MADIEKIQGDALLQLFNDLQSEQTPLKLELANSENVQETFVTGIRKRRKALHFLINAPDGHKDRFEDPSQTRLRFEFIDKENIKYIFESDSWELSKGSIWIKFPGFVHRFQRRKLFRLEAPHGTRLYFKVNDVRYKLLVINLSLGGTLGVLVSLTEQMEQELRRYGSRILENVELLFPSKDRKQIGSIVNIKRCQIKRQEKNPVTNKFECAIEFKEISEKQQKNLTELFYKSQREYLRKRRLLRA